MASPTTVPAGEDALARRQRRTTLVLPEIVARNVAIVCGREGLPQNEYMYRLIREDLSRRGLNPDTLPNMGELRPLPA
jgi:hypothetical protein